jgi:hypothetical protein
MRIATLALGFILGSVVFIGASIVLAWTGPAAAPPSGNVDAPINVGTTDQIKNAGLGVNSLAVFGNAILSGTSRYLNFGDSAGESGYGIRDNAGTMEFKDNEGSWSRFLASTNVQSISFADGTTQTTAAGGPISGSVGGGCTGAAEQGEAEGQGGGSGGGWGNATNCSTNTVCNATTISGTCPSGYTATRVGVGPQACAGGNQNCSCGGQSVLGNTIYRPSYYRAPMICVQN